MNSQNNHSESHSQSHSQLYEPIVSVDQIDLDLVKIKNGKFTYSNETLKEFELKILCERIPVKLHEDLNLMYIESAILYELRHKFDKMIKDYKIENKVENSINYVSTPVNRFGKKIKVNYTKNSKIKVIPTKVSGEQKYFIRSEDDFHKFIVINKNNKSLETNIIIKPKMIKKTDYTWLEIHYADIFHKSSTNTNTIYKKIYSIENTIQNKSITL